MYLAPSMNPENPDQVEVTRRPSDALEAQQAAEDGFYQPFARSWVLLPYSLVELQSLM